MSSKFKYSTGILVLNEDGELLMLKKVKNGLWSCPGGKVEQGENALDCAVRELEEETGLKDIKLDFFTYLSCENAGITWIETMYICNISNDDNINISEDHNFSEYKFFDLDKIPERENMENYSMNLIKVLKGEKEKILDRSLIFK